MFYSLLKDQLCEDCVISQICGSFHIYYQDYFFYIKPKEVGKCYVSGWHRNKTLFTHVFKPISIDEAFNLILKYVPEKDYCLF